MSIQKNMDCTYTLFKEKKNLLLICKTILMFKRSRMNELCHLQYCLNTIYKNNACLFLSNFYMAS